ncbi:MAG: caspase family protein, partial [Chitinophagaceae bacterium]
AQMNYDDYKSAQKEILLDDQFTSVKNSWSMDKNGEITNGNLIIDASLMHANIKRSSLLRLNIDQTKDFEIETSFSFRSKGDFAFVLGKLFWNFSNEDPTLTFTQPVSSEILVWVAENKTKNEEYLIKKQTVLNKVSKTNFNIKEFNKFTLRKIKDRFYYFINEQYVDYLPFRIITDAQIGFWAAGQRLNVDYVTISYLLPGNQTNNENNTFPDRSPAKVDGLIPIRHEIKQGGKYYALVIGVSKYNEPKLNLDKPEKDAEKIKELFVKRYSFGDSTTYLLLNPTRQKIISELYRLRKIIGPNDNLLIFYAGHGFWDEDARQGYWWAKDAVPDDPSTWLSNSDLREQIRSIKSAHTLLISDACFSGGIFKTRSGNDIQNASRDIQMLYQMPSRRAITSGTMTAVPDNSVFLEYLSKRLTDNKNKFLSSQQLFDSFRAAVINNSSAVPQDGVIAETGDEGGDFIFILKEN